jgi:hypothetical protein
MAALCLTSNIALNKACPENYDFEASVIFNIRHHKGLQ